MSDKPDFKAILDAIHGLETLLIPLLAESAPASWAVSLDFVACAAKEEVKVEIMIQEMTKDAPT